MASVSSLRPLLLALLQALLCCWLSAEGPVPPVLRLPPCAQAPTIDGDMKPGEWDSAFAGFGMIGERRQARYFLTYDKDTLYVAMQTELPPWGTIDGRIRRIPAEVFHDDHFELHINPPREPEHPDKAYYQFVGNCKGSYWNSQHTDQNPGFLPFIGDWTYRNSVREGWWTWELSTPVAALGNARIVPGTTWGFKFVRSWHQPRAENFWPAGGYFDRALYLQVTLDDKSPAIQVPGFGPWWKGQCDVPVVVRNPSAEPRPLVVDLTVTEGERSKSLHKEITVDPGGRAELRFSEELAIEKSASLNLRIASPDGGKVYYADVRPFPRQDESPLWVAAAEEQDDVSFHAFFYPGVSRLRCEVSFPGFKQAGTVTKASITVKDAQGKDVAAADIRKFMEGEGDTVIQLPQPLAPGTYDAQLVLYAGDRAIAGPLSDRFEKKTFPFEGNRLGISDQVLPPWTPLECARPERRLSCWGRVYTFAEDGLISQVKSLGTDLLARPMGWVARSGGAPLPWNPGALEWTTTAPHEAGFTASSSCEKVEAAVRVHAEYDGMVRYEVTLSPRGDGNLESLDLVVPLRADGVTLMHATGDGCRSNYGGIVPAGEGRVWDSTRVGNWSLAGTFIPYLWVGNERLGLCWWADKDEGWVRPADRKAPAIEVRRTPEEVQMVFHVVARPIELKSPRTLVFAFEATPVRPKPGWARRASIYSWQNPHADGLKVSWFGSTAWALSGTDRYKNLPYTFMHIRPVDRECEEWLKKRMEQIHGEGRIGLAYTDYRARSYSEEVRSYAWEWAKFGASLRKQDVENAGPVHGLEVNSTQSRIDYDLWCLQNNMSLGMDAWYFDEIQCTADRNLAANRGWVNEQGEPEGQCTLFALREFLKRLYTIMVERGQKEPLIVMHMTSTAYAGPLAFSTVTFDYEYGQTDPDRRVLLLLGLDGFRATAMGHPYGFVGTVINTERNSPHIRFGDWQPLRNWVGMQLLHDLNLQVSPHIGGILKEFGYYEDDCRFTGYWDAHGKLYDVEPGHIRVSVFRRGNKAMLVFLNTANQDALALWRPKKETGMTSNLWDADPAFGTTFYWTSHDERGFRKIFVPKYDYRLVLVNCSGNW